MASWQSTVKSLSNAAERLLETGIYHDVIYEVGKPPNSKSFKCHKLILAMRSDVFEMELYYGSKPTEGTLLVTDTEPDVFHKMLKYMYTDSLDLTSMQEAKNVLRASMKYNISPLTRLCRKFIERNLTSENVLQVYELAVLLQDKQFIAKCEDIVGNNSTKILNSEAFLSCSQEVVKSVLKQTNLGERNESSVFKIVLKWAEAECRRANLEVIPSNLRKLFDPLLPYVRFLLMSQEEFVLGPVESKILEADEVISIMTNITVRGIREMPSWYIEEAKQGNTK